MSDTKQSIAYATHRLRNPWVVKRAVLIRTNSWLTHEKHMLTKEMDTERMYVIPCDAAPCDAVPMSEDALTATLRHSEEALLLQSTEKKHREEAQR